MCCLEDDFRFVKKSEILSKTPKNKYFKQIFNFNIFQTWRGSIRLKFKKKKKKKKKKLNKNNGF